MKEHRGTMVLILGILSLVVCAPIGIAAWLMGKNDLAEMAAGTMDPAGKQITNIGMICGIIGMVLLILGLVISVIMVALGATAAVAG